MTAKHTVAAFNHSCLQVPVNPANKLPLPTFERKRVSNYFENDHINKKGSNKGTTRSFEFLVGADPPSSSDSRERISETSTHQDNTNLTLKTMDKSTDDESLQSFIAFYESIPDYGDLNHLSDRDFYLRLQNLKAKQRMYLKDLSEKDFGIVGLVEENKLCTRNKFNKRTSVQSETWQRHYNDSLNLQSKKCVLDDDKNTVPNSVGYQRKVKKYSDSSYSSLFWDKLDSNNDISPTVPAVSLEDTHKISGRTNPKSAMQVNNYVLATEESETASGIGMASSQVLDKEHKFKGPLPQRTSYKIKVKRPNGTNKIRDTHTSPAYKTGTLIDSSNSTIDNLWDGFSFDDYVSKVELFSDSDSEQDDMLALAVPRSVPNSPALKHNKTVAWQEPKITIPKPFNMTLRRQQVRRQCMNKLRAQMKPFQFTKRDEERKLLRMCHSSPDLRDFSDTLTKPKPFKAKPVPKNLFSSYVYQKMREDEYYRSLKKKIRAEELLKSSSLPPSMAARERLFNAKALSAEVYNSDSDGLKRRKHKIPNYKKSHEQIQKELEDRWNDNITTSPQPFTLRTAELHKRKSAKFTSPDESSAVSPHEVYPYTDSRRHVRSQSALGIPLNRNNLASVLRIQSSRQRMERELAVRQEESRKKEVERFKAHVTRCKPAWQALNYSTEEDLAMRIQARREEERIRREEYEEDMQLMLSRVEKIPTLFERQSQNMMKEIHKKYRMPERKLRHNMKIMSAPNTPDLYEEDEREDDGENQNEISYDKNIKVEFKVSVSEIPETVHFKTENEDVEETEVVEKDENDHEVLNEKNDKKKVQEEIEEYNDAEEDNDEESENTESIQEDMSPGKSTDEDDENGNTYTIDE